MAKILIGLGLGIAIAVLAWWAGALSTSGMIAAAITGGMIFGFGGWAWAILLLAFFISSSGLSRAFSRRKAGLNEKFSKGNRRDWGQVLANGGLAALLAAVYGLAVQSGEAPAWLWPAFAGALAAVNADTWATEIGVLSRGAPRLITTGKPVERGTSGGISLLGVLASLSGAALIGVIGAASAEKLSPQTFIYFTASITVAGLLGSLADSLLGATIQAIYFCPACQKETERHPLHTCGTPTIQRHGWRWMGNDWVNFICSLVGALVAALLGLLL